MKIPEWVHCVATGMHIDDKSEKVSWCGRKLYSEWHFVDPTHAALNGRQKGYLVACKNCVEEIVKALRNGNNYELELENKNK